MLNFARTTTYRKLDHDAQVIVLNIDPTVTIAEGTPCYWDATNKVAKPIPATSGVGATDDAIVAAYVGIAQGTNPVKYHGSTKKMSFYIGDVIARLYMHTGMAIDMMTPVFQADEIGVANVAAGVGPAERTKALGHVILDAEEFKVARTTTEGEEVSILLRASIFKTRTF